MKKLFLLFAVSAAWAWCAVAAETNLVLNGTFDMKGKHFPPFWMFRSHTPSVVDAFPDGGPDGLGFMRISCRKAGIAVRQGYLTLVQVGKYRFSAKVRTRGLSDKDQIIVRPIAGSEIKLPAKQAEWKEVSVTFSPKRDDTYTVYLEVNTPGGVLDITDVRLVPLNDEAVKGSRRQIENMTPSLVPLDLLDHIDRKAPKVAFFHVGKLPGKPEDLRCVFTLGRNSGKKVEVPFTTRKFTVDLKALAAPAGKNTLSLAIVNRADGKTVHKQDYPVRFIDLPAMKNPAKRLNNLVRVAFEGNIPGGGSIRFDNPRNGWVLIRYTSAERPTLRIDGKIVLEKDFPHGSTVRYLDAGVCELRNEGRTAGVSVRLIPDIHMFPLGSSRMPGNGVYNWEFAKKHMLPALTAINVGGITEEQKKEVSRFGLLYIANFSVHSKKKNDGQDLLDRLNAFKDLQGTLYDGTSMDEVEYWDAPAINPYVWALKNFKNPNDKEIRSWVIGPPSFSYCDYISTACNISGGRGRVLYEVYNRAQYTEQDAANYIRQTAQHAALYKDIAPGLFGNISIILGNFSQAPGISLDSIPSVDFRYYLDMQMHLLATHPDLDGLGGIGYWGSMNCDEETLRWCFALLKHYAVEGNTTMLSEKYGFTYNLKLIENPDFEEGLKGWEVSGDVTAGKFEQFGDKYQFRYGSVYTQGDTFAILARDVNKAAEVRQKMTGLVPGKLYTVFYMTADYDDLLKGVNAPYRIPLHLTVKGGEITWRSYYVDYRKGTQYKARVNSCKYIFRAKGTEAELVFSNRKALPGSRQVLNYVTVREYFDK